MRSPTSVASRAPTEYRGESRLLCDGSGYSQDLRLDRPRTCVVEGVDSGEDIDVNYIRNTIWYPTAFKGEGVPSPDLPHTDEDAKCFGYFYRTQVRYPHL